MKNLLAKEFKDRIESLRKEEIELKEGIKKLQELKEITKAPEEIKYSVEKKFNGFHCSIHKKDSQIKIFSEHKKDLTNAFPTLVKDITKLSDKDFIVDGELVPYENDKALGRNVLMKFIGAIRSGKKPDDSKIRLHIWDCLYFNKSIIDLSLKERLEFLNKLKFTKRITNADRKIVTFKELKEAIEWASKLKNSEGAVIKKLDIPYSFGKKSWVKYRKLNEIKVVILKKNPIKDNVVNYSTGIYLAEEEIKKINPKYIIEFKDKKVMPLGNTFNTSITTGEIGNTLSLLVEEIWRHETKKGIRYSLHKPKVKDLYKEFKKTSSLDEFEDIVASTGVAIKYSEIENQEVFDLIPDFYFYEILAEWNLEHKGEGKEVMVKNFPDKMQTYFKKVMKSKKWYPFVMQWHLRGKKSLHTDCRFKVNDHLEGITLFTPPSIDKPDLLIPDAKNIRGTVKVPQPTEWLTVYGRFERGGPGTTKEFPAYFSIVAKGKYQIKEVTDHKIIFELRSDKGKVKKIKVKKGEEYIEAFNKKLPDSLKQLNGNYIFQIAHIGERHIFLFNKLKK